MFLHITQILPLIVPVQWFYPDTVFLYWVFVFSYSIDVVSNLSYTRWTYVQNLFLVRDSTCIIRGCTNYIDGLPEWVLGESLLQLVMRYSSALKSEQTRRFFTCQKVPLNCLPIERVSTASMVNANINDFDQLKRYWRGKWNILKFNRSNIYSN